MAKEVKEAVVETKKVEEEKRFAINIEGGKDAEGNSLLFIFSGPEKASLGLIYDASHRVMLEIIAYLQKRAVDLGPKKPEEAEDKSKKSLD